MGRKLKGFTIVETLVFLTVSGAIFLSVSLLITGQIDRTRSKDAVNQLDSTVRGALNDVANGYYPEVSGLTVTCNGGTNARGQNSKCVLIGKKLTFDTDKLYIDTMTAPSSVSTIDLAKTSMTPIGGLRETYDYKWAIQAKNSQTYYILNTNYCSADNANCGTFISGAQSVKLFDSVLHETTATSTVCFTNGDHNSSLVFNAVGGSLTVQANQADGSC